MILKSENVSKENESTRLLLRNISEIYFTKLSNQSGSENKEISEAIGRVFGSIQLLGNSLGQSYRVRIRENIFLCVNSLISVPSNSADSKFFQ